MGKKKQVTVSAEVKTETKTEEPKRSSQTQTKKPEKATKRVVRQHGKAYLEAKNRFLNQKALPLKEALSILKKISYEKFNATVELHLNLNEPNLKGEVTLPHGTGRTLKIAVFDDDIEAQIKENKIDFDVLVAQPKDMAKLVKYAKFLGPRGLMPSPKKGTLTEDHKTAVKKLASGTLNYKSESKFPLLHQIVGKRDFTEAQLRENIVAFVLAVNPKHIVGAVLKTSMSPAIKLQLDSIK